MTLLKDSLKNLYKININGSYADKLENVRDLQQLEIDTTLTKANASNVVEKVTNLQTEIKKLSKEKESLQQKIANAELNNLVNNIKEVNGVNVLTSVVESENMNHLKQLVDNAKSKLENYVIAFASVNEDKVNFVVAVDKAITDKYNAGKLVNVLATVCDDPFIALGEYGKGRSAVFTTDCAPHWAPPEFCEWKDYNRLFQNLARWLTKEA